MKIRTYSRKGKCLSCGVSTGSKHNKMCPYAYAPERDSKMKKATMVDKLKAILTIVKL